MVKYVDRIPRYGLVPSSALLPVSVSKEEMMGGGGGTKEEDENPNHTFLTNGGSAFSAAPVRFSYLPVRGGGGREVFYVGYTGLRCSLIHHHLELGASQGVQGKSAA